MQRNDLMEIHTVYFYQAVITILKLINTSITSRGCPFSVVRTLEIYSLSKLQVHTRVSITVLYMGSQSSFICNRTCVPLTSTSPPPAPSNRHSTLCFYKSAFFRFHTCEIMQYWSFCVWLVLLSITSSRCIHVVTNVRISFFLYG